MVDSRREYGALENGRLQNSKSRTSDVKGDATKQRRAWWCFWAVLGAASAAIELLPELPGSALRADSLVQVAYLDPGAGSFVIQALVAMLAGIVVATRVYWQRIKGFLGMATPSEDEDEAEERREDA
jgi:hypothetical protein